MISYVPKSRVIRAQPGNFGTNGRGVECSQFAICICEMQKLRVFSSRDEPKIVWRVTVGINLILMLRRIIFDYRKVQIPGYLKPIAF